MLSTNNRLSYVQRQQKKVRSFLGPLTNMQRQSIFIPGLPVMNSNNLLLPMHTESLFFNIQHMC